MGRRRDEEGEGKKVIVLSIDESIKQGDGTGGGDEPPPDLKYTIKKATNACFVFMQALQNLGDTVEEAFTPEEAFYLTKKLGAESITGTLWDEKMNVDKKFLQETVEQIKMIFDGYVAAGFTREQAIEMVFSD